MGVFLPAFLKRRAREAPWPERLDLDTHSVPLSFREHPTAKRLIMRVTPAGGIVVTMPRRTARRTVLEFVERHRGWAASRLTERRPSVRIADGGSLPFRGGTLLLVHRPSIRATRLRQADGEGPVLEVGGEAAFMGRRVRDFLARQARADLMDAVARHATTVGKQPRAIAIKDTVSRWGSCTADRRLSFSFRIVMAPPSVLDYLAAHEVAHFVHMNHSAEFWALCRALCPHTQESRRWLKAEGTALQAIEFIPAEG